MKTSFGVALVSTAIIQLAGFQSIAIAQEPVLEEITVTAQRREQSLQEVPISVTAFTGEDLVRGNINSTQGFLRFVPNVTFDDANQREVSRSGVTHTD